MSGGKEGFAPVPIVAPMAIAAIGAVAAAGIICMGVARLTKETYNRISEAADQAAARELERIRESIREATKVMGDTSVTHLVAADNYEQAIGCLLAEERKAVSENDAVARFLAAQHSDRVEHEKKSGLRSDLSDRISKRMKEYQEMKKKAEMALRKKEEELKARQLSEREAEVASRLTEIELMVKVLAPYFPDLASKVRWHLPKVKKEAKTLDRLIKTNQLRERFERIRDSGFREQVSGLLAVRVRYASNPLMARLPSKIRAQFSKACSDAVSRAETGRYVAADVARLEAMLAKHKAEAELADREARFEETERLARAALFAQGYERVEQVRTDTTAVLLAVRSNGQSATVRIALPETGDEVEPILHLEISEKGYDSPEAWKAEGVGIAKEIESQGVVISFAEDSTHFKGVLLEHSAELLKKRYEEKNPGTAVSVTLEKNNHIMVNGRLLRWVPGLKVSDLLAQLDSPPPGPDRAPEKTREMERE